MTNRRALALLSGGHVVDDLYRGAVPAALPFLVAERGYSYAAASGLVLAATVTSSVAPVAGLACTAGLSDPRTTRRRARARVETEAGR